MDQFVAGESALGYIYQVRCALLWSLQRLKTEDDFQTAIEKLDDVSFEANGTPQELLQTKLHKNRGANLTNASSDLWHTIRIWLVRLDNNEITEKTDLYLVTTETAAVGTTAGYLTVKHRDIEKALAGLNSTASSSSNESNADAYKLYLAKSEEEKRSFLNRVVVVDSSADMPELTEMLLNEIYHAVGREKQETFLQYLEGWWFRVVIEQLTATGFQKSILSDELESQMSDLRDQFKQDCLPIADELLNFTLDDEVSAQHSTFPFVQQIELIKANKTRIAAAIRDYYRAYAQRSRWLREDLLVVGNLTTYEKLLREEWELVFAATEDRIGSDASEDVKLKAALDVLSWAESAAAKSRIRPNVVEPFITRGSLHILANKVDIGWHLDFKDRLANILNGGSQP